MGSRLLSRLFPYGISNDGFRWGTDKSVDIELVGPDSDYRCGDEVGYEACYGPGSTYIEAEIRRPADIIYVFKGVSASDAEGIAGGVPDAHEKEYIPPDTSRPFLKIEGYHMNDSPSDDNVLYLQED